MFYNRLSFLISHTFLISHNLKTESEDKQTWINLSLTNKNRSAEGDEYFNLLKFETGTFGIRMSD